MPGDPAKPAGPVASSDPGAAAAPVTAADLPGAEDEQGWHRLHPVTPFLRSWKIIAAVLVIGAQQGLDDLVGLARALEGGVQIGLVAILILVGVVLVAMSLLAGWAWWSWRMTRYRVHGDTLEHEVGILFRQHRQARLDRLQAVDVVQPLLGRIFGLSELRLEVAGGPGSDVRLQYLRDNDADRLRNVLLARAAGVRYTGPEAPVAPEHQLVALPPPRLVQSLALSWDTMISIVLLVGVAIGTFFERAALFTSIPIVLGVASTIWARFSRGFNFTAGISPDGLRLRHGLLETRTQTVPPGRVQAVQMSQPVLWRKKDWWTLKVNVAGYGPTGSGESSSSSVLMPVATRDEAFLLLAQVLPDLGTPDPIRLLNEGLEGLAPKDGSAAPQPVPMGEYGRLGPGEDDPDDSAPAGFTCAPRRSRWLDPIAWRRNAFVITETAMLIRSGLVHRTLQFVPHARTQSLGLRQGWLQRRLQLASVVCHSTPGPVDPQVRHLDQQVAGELLIRQATRAKQARAMSPHEQWMTGHQTPPRPAPEPEPEAPRPEHSGPDLPPPDPAARVDLTKRH